MGITVGDFDGDNYEDIAVYFSYRNNPKIGIFTQSKNENKPLFEWKYSVDLKSISSDFNCCKDTNRPLVSLSTTDISGSDDLVVSVTMPYSNDHDFAKMVIPLFTNGKRISLSESILIKVKALEEE